MMLKLKKINFVAVGVLGVLSYLFINTFSITLLQADENIVVEECAKCHKAEANSYALTMHANDNKCDICHGDGRAHIKGVLEKQEGVVNPRTLTASKSKVICLNCHNNKDRDLEEVFLSRANLHDDIHCFECHKVHALGTSGAADSGDFREDMSADCASCHEENDESFYDSEHGLASMQCIDCHKFHKSSTISENIEEQIERCLSCHPTQDLEFRDQYTHPLRERQIQCTDCHNPHSNEFENMLRKDEDRVCEDCHGDVFIGKGKHPESKGTNHPFGAVLCTECHRPHGSNFQKILKYDVNSICNTCHN